MSEELQRLKDATCSHQKKHEDRSLKFMFMKWFMVAKLDMIQIKSSQQITDETLSLKVTLAVRIQKMIMRNELRYLQ